MLSERDDIIVITDEAHRSQYDQLAANMRRALPNAAFIGFTGTPLIAGQEERTREVFGDYVSIYNFAQSIADGATVPLYYEARKPELQLAADELKDELDALLDEAALDEEQEKKLQQTFGKQYHLITRERPAGRDCNGPRAPLLRAGLSRQSHVRRHRQGDRRADVREGAQGVGNRTGVARSSNSRALPRKCDLRSPNASTGCAPWTWPSWSASRKTKSTT